MEMLVPPICEEVIYHGNGYDNCENEADLIVEITTDDRFTYSYKLCRSCYAKMILNYVFDRDNYLWSRNNWAKRIVRKLDLKDHEVVIIIPVHFVDNIGR